MGWNCSIKDDNMAKAEQLAILRDGAEAWNKWKASMRHKLVPGVDFDLREADLSGANLSGIDLDGTILINTNFSKARLSNANLGGCNLRGADFSHAIPSGANFREANLYLSSFRESDLTDADLTKANLTGTQFMSTKVGRAKISGSKVYGINVWDLEGDFEEQKDLVITETDQPVVTVDNIEVAQFIYLVLNNKKLRDVLNTITSKSVLILGRFTLPERKEILDALRKKLREYNLLPIVFDFDRPTDRDFTETIRTLAGLSYFVIADITNPKSSPLELQATVPDYQIPFVPIIQEGEQPFAMMVDLQKKYNWVLDTLSYSSIDALIKALKPAIIDPAIQKHNELRLIKAREPKIRSASDFIKDKGLDNQSNSDES
jgi:Pentapeptide repeats (8 copies)